MAEDFVVDDFLKPAVLNVIDSSQYGAVPKSSSTLTLISILGMISVQVPTSLCMQNKLIIHSRYCFVEQSVYPREPNIYMGNLYLRDE